MNERKPGYYALLNEIRSSFMDYLYSDDVLEDAKHIFELLNATTKLEYECENMDRRYEELLKEKERVEESKNFWYKMYKEREKTKE